MICIGRHVGGHTLALQHGDQNGACNLQVAGRRLQVAGQNLKYARTVNAKVILRNRKKTVFTASRKPEISRPRKLFFWELEFASESLWIKISQLHTFKNNSEW